MLIHLEMMENLGKMGIWEMLMEKSGENGRRRLWEIRMKSW